MKRKLALTFRSLAWTLFLLLITAGPALAHEGPDDGAEWLMADWMLMSFLVFFAVALVVFVIALKRGYFSHLEQAKYYLLSIDEPDYYTPEWARQEEIDDPNRE